MTEFFSPILLAYFVFVLLYFLGVNFIYTLFLGISWREILDYLRQSSFANLPSLLQSAFSYRVSILAPAFNEEKTIKESVQSLLKLQYTAYEVVVVNDGSTDATLERLIRDFDLRKTRQYYHAVIPTKTVRGIYTSRNPAYKNLIVVDKENGGKADALNAGINCAHYEYICCIDADSILEDNALLKAMKPFHEDKRVIAVGGIVRIANGCEVLNGRVVRVGLSTKMLPIFQVVEYLRAFLSGRMFWNIFQGSLIVSGAFGIFKKSVVVAAGGYRTDTVGEDMELVTRLHRMMLERKIPYKILFIPDPVCWTEAPETFKGLSRQRNRWHRGLLETLLYHRTMIFNPKYKMVGMGALPHFLFVELLGPVFEAIGYVVMAIMYFYGILNVEYAILFFITALFYGSMFSVGAVMLEEISFHRYPKPIELALLLSFGIIENFGYRQLTVYWRLKGLIDYLLGKRMWGKMARKGF